MSINFKALIVAIMCAALLALAFRYELIADVVGGFVVLIAVIVATLVSVIELTGPSSDGLWRRLRLRRRARSPFP
jgi:hypothetical protein